MADGFRLIVHDASARSFLGRVNVAVGEGLARLMRQYGQLMVRMVKENIRTQGDTFGSKWRPASKWIVAKKARHSVLLEAIPNVKFQAYSGSVRVFFASPGEWSLTQHHQGFTVPPSGHRETFALRRPSVLGKKTNTFSFISRKPSVVPARRIWPTDTQKRMYMNSLLERFGIDLAQRSGAR